MDPRRTPLPTEENKLDNTTASTAH